MIFTKLRNINGEFEFIKLNSNEIEGFEEPYDNSYDWIVYLKDNKTPIANIVADRECKENNSIELAFNTHPNYWRKGYTLEALIEIIKFLFKNGYDNIICSYDEGNYKSKNISLKLGFLPYSVKKDAWTKDGISITTYTTMLSKKRYKELYKTN